jgi:hypothetical protein
MPLYINTKGYKKGKQTNYFYMKKKNTSINIIDNNNNNKYKVIKSLSRINKYKINKRRNL